MLLVARWGGSLSRGLACGASLRQISRQVHRAPSTVSREVERHGGRRRYRAATADAAAWARGRRPKRCRLEVHPALRDAVATKLAQKWSPQQIAGWLRQAYPDDPTMHVSHGTIYLSLFVQSRGVLKKALQAQLRQRRTIRRPRTAPPQYLPKGTDLARHTQAQLNRIARELNTRPRKTLGYRTPADILAETVAPTD